MGKQKQAPLRFLPSCRLNVLSMKPLFYQLSIVVATQFASFSAGAAMGFPSVLLYQLRKKDSDISLDLDNASWIGSFHGLAGIPGIIAPIIMQWKGRKFTFIGGCFILLLGWALVYLANSIAMIILSESVHGFGANVLITVRYDCLSEMITPRYRNVAVQSYGIVNVLGVAVAGVMTKFVHRRTQSIIFTLPAIVGVLFAWTWLESPLWLAYKKDLVNCKINFTKIRGTGEHSMKELEEVMLAHKEIKLSRNKAEGVVKRFLRQVTSRDFIIPAFHVLLLLNHSYWSGSVVVLTYSIELISKTTQNETAAYVGGIIIDFVLVISAIISSVLIRFYNNKPVILVSTCGATVCLLSLSLVTYLQGADILPKDSWLSLYFLVGYMIATGLGQTSVVFTMSSELMPVKHRGLGGALFVIYACSLHASSLKISPYLFVYLEFWGTFLIYTLNSIICGLLIWKYVPETKGKTLQEIENFYKNGTFEIILSSNEECDLIEVTKI